MVENKVYIQMYAVRVPGFITPGHQKIIYRVDIDIARNDHDSKLYRNPIAILEYIVHTNSTQATWCSNPFMGGGTTGIAATKSAMKFIGCEPDEDYFPLASQRIQVQADRDVNHKE